MNNTQEINTQNYYSKRERERERVTCKLCHRETDNNKKVCQPCINERRPKVKTGWLIFWFFFSAGIGALIYYFWAKNKGEEWDRENL